MVCLFRSFAPLVVMPLVVLISLMPSLVENGELQWCFSQVKGTIEEDVTEG